MIVDNHTLVNPTEQFNENGQQGHVSFTAMPATDGALSLRFKGGRINGDTITKSHPLVQVAKSRLAERYPSYKVWDAHIAKDRAEAAVNRLAMLVQKDLRTLTAHQQEYEAAKKHLARCELKVRELS